ncbi:hypothetical protein [Nonomuraea salmonea]
MRSTTSLDELSEDLHPSSAAPLSEEEVRGARGPRPGVAAR